MHVFLPALRQAVLVLETVLQALHVKIAEMEQIQILGYMEVMSFNPVKAASPYQRSGQDGGLCIAGADLGIVTLLKERPVFGNIGLFAQFLPEIQPQGRQGAINLYRAQIL